MHGCSQVDLKLQKIPKACWIYSGLRQDVDGTWLHWDVRENRRSVHSVTVNVGVDVVDYILSWAVFWCTRWNVRVIDLVSRADIVFIWIGSCGIFVGPKLAQVVWASLDHHSAREVWGRRLYLGLVTVVLGIYLLYAFDPAILISKLSLDKYESRILDLRILKILTSALLYMLPYRDLTIDPSMYRRPWLLPAEWGSLRLEPRPEVARKRY